jgi:hypothetical protein
MLRLVLQQFFDFLQPIDLLALLLGEKLSPNRDFWLFRLVAYAFSVQNCSGDAKAANVFGRSRECYQASVAGRFLLIFLCRKPVIPLPSFG